MEKTVLEVNLPSIVYNLGLVRSLVGESGKIIAVVKANSYGLGMEMVSRSLSAAGVNFFAVALVEEGIALRLSGISGKILILSPFLSEEVGDIIEYDLIPSVVSLGRARDLDREASRLGKRVLVHIKVDTGMGRLGVRYENVFNFLSEASDLSNLVIDGIYSHFASADIPDKEFTNLQISRFCELRSVLGLTFSNVLFHLANSSGIVCFPDSYFSGVRPGLMLYGAYPSSFVAGEIVLRKVIKLKSFIVSLKTLDIGDSVSYGRTFVAKRKTRVGVLSIGYADGYSTLLSNCGEAILRGIRVPVLGRVCMDYTMIDVSSVDGVSVGDEAILIGDGITEEELASKTGLIPYEVLTSIGARVKRVYCNNATSSEATLD